MSALPKKKYSLEEYFALERESDMRHEYLEGDIYAMSGGSRSHERIVSDMDTILNIQLREKGCEVFASNMRLKTAARSFLYADLSVVCGEAEFIEEGGLDHLANPILVVEVLSESTEQFDRREKFWRYQSIPSLRDYVLVDQHRPVLEIYTRQDGDRWLYRVTRGLDASVILDSIGCTLALSEGYRRVTFAAEDDPLTTDD